MRSMPSLETLLRLRDELKGAKAIILARETTIAELQAKLETVTGGDPLPCPFCGQCNVQHDSLLIGDKRRYVVQCRECQTIGPEGDDLRDSVRLWNDRK